jgi:3-oxoadipate enol-lactonase
MPRAINAGVHLHWQQRGSGSAVLLIMGHSYSSRMWYPLIAALAAKHRVISFDNRGTGDSDTTRRVTVQQMAQDALAVMDAAGVDRAHVHGVSMGGVIALELAMQQPSRVRSLVLGCTGILSPEKPRFPAILRLLYYVPALLRWLRARDRGDGYGSIAKAENVAADRAILAADRSTIRGRAAQAGAIARYRTTLEAVARLQMPALILHGDEDKTVPHAYGVELASTLPHARLVTIEGASHNYVVAAPEKSAAILDAFLDGCDQAL